MRDWTLYDGIEIAGCVNDGDGCITAVVGSEGIVPEFYTVYLHRTEGGVEALYDFDTYNAAACYAQALGARCGLDILDYTKL